VCVCVLDGLYFSLMDTVQEESITVFYYADIVPFPLPPADKGSR